MKTLKFYVSESVGLENTPLGRGVFGYSSPLNPTHTKKITKEVSDDLILILDPKGKGCCASDLTRSFDEKTNIDFPAFSMVVKDINTNKTHLYNICAKTDAVLDDHIIRAAKKKILEHYGIYTHFELEESFKEIILRATNCPLEYEDMAEQKSDIEDLVNRYGFGSIGLTALKLENEFINEIEETFGVTSGVFSDATISASEISDVAKLHGYSAVVLKDIEQGLDAYIVVK